jgi:DNA-binding SARP family transcriptional activator
MVKTVDFFLFGTPRILVKNHPVEIERRKAMALAAYLVLAEIPVSRDAVAALLWPDSDQERARNTLRTTLSSLTGLSAEPWLIADRSSIEVNRDAVWSDVGEFTSLLAQSRSHKHAPDDLCTECLELLPGAAALYRDDLMTGFSLSDSADFDDWQRFQQEWLRDEFGSVLRRLAQYYGDHQQFDQALPYARRWLNLDPLHEPAHRLLMRLYAANGQRNEALRQYQECVEILDRELATPPEAETTALYESIRNNSYTHVPAQPAEQNAAPVSGILPPLPSLMIGREDALTDIKRRLGIGAPMRAATVIQGWPGVGKSTLVASLAHDADIAAAFPDGILWASLGETPSLLAELSTWAEALKFSRSADKPQKIEEISALLTAVLRDRRMLLIVDDVWQIDHATPFRVGGQACAMLMTSRLNDVAQGLVSTPSDIYRLTVLSEQRALELLSTLAPTAVEEHPEESRELVTDLEGLPLAIQVAGRLLQSEAQFGWGVGDLLRELRTGAGLLTAAAPGDVIGARRDTTPTIAALLQRSTDALDEETRFRFAVLGLFVPKPATFDLAAMSIAWELPDPKPTARLLVNRGLLEPVSGGRFQMHALLVLHARSLLEEV